MVQEETNKEITQAGSKELRMRLPRGAVREIATELNISWVWVYRVVSGLSSGDPRIIALAIEHARIGDEKRRRLSEMVERNRREIDQLV